MPTHIRHTYFVLFIFFALLGTSMLSWHRAIVPSAAEPVFIALSVVVMLAALAFGAAWLHTYRGRFMAPPSSHRTKAALWATFGFALVAVGVLLVWTRGGSPAMFQAAFQCVMLGGLSVVSALAWHLRMIALAHRYEASPA